MSRARTEQIASVMLALILGILLALAVVHWIELEGITSERAASAAASLMALPGHWARRYWAWVRYHVRLDTERRQLKWIEEDIEHMERELAFLPQHIRYLRGEAARLRVCVALLEKHGPNALTPHECTTSRQGAAPSTTSQEPQP